MENGTINEQEQENGESDDDDNQSCGSSSSSSCSSERFSSASSLDSKYELVAALEKAAFISPAEAAEHYKYFEYKRRAFPSQDDQTHKRRSGVTEQIMNRLKMKRNGGQKDSEQKGGKFKGKNRMNEGLDDPAKMAGYPTDLQDVRPDSGKDGLTEFKKMCVAGSSTGKRMHYGDTKECSVYGYNAFSRVPYSRTT
ncbi:hypothetical protein DM02DRAFT_651758 [Periconia macrospinosa]|uniref:Uncharacterized protein n=1 Tax=Periconia macrospinosa TaxID=97972 RepID=A0A2V1E296_9PLEO|nr:hypothetical protein DM02DRAFT_651758 [Periconia macrospinosa]